MVKHIQPTNTPNNTKKQNSTNNTNNNEQLIYTIRIRYKLQGGK